MRRLSTALFVCLALWLVVASGQQSGAPDSSYVADEVLVKFHPEASQSRRDIALAGRGAQLLRRFGALDLQHAKLPKGQSVTDAVAALNANPDVEFAQPNYVRHITQSAPPNDPLWLDGTLWGLLKIQAASAWSTFGTGDGSTLIADIDTGVNYNHPDLAANIWTNPAEIPGNGIDDDGDGYIDDVHGINVLTHSGDPMDDHGHGTHTSGTIAAIGNNGTGVVGVLWNAKIVACKFLDATGNGSDAGAVECFNYVVALKNRGFNIRVTSNSWGGNRGCCIGTVLKNAIDAAGNAGILNAFAAGNNGANNDSVPFDPASFPSPSIVSVAASDSNDARAGFSNYGATTVHLAAPGVSIASTYGSGYGSMSGTSMATPHVAGAAAMIALLNPALTPASIKSVLMNNVDALAPWTGLVVSGGRLNLFKAAGAAFGNMPPVVALTSPSQGATFVPPASVTVSANASDPGGSVSSVAFYASGTLIGTDTTSPYSVTWSNVTTGTYSVTAVATDNKGLTATSSPVSITVNKTPTVTLTSPAAGPAGAAPATVALAATASDTDGTISSVKWFANGSIVATDSSSPYSASWTNVAAGTYAVTAMATDNLGGTATTAAVTITVNAKPTVALTSPAAGPAGTAPAAVTASASASDSDGTIASVAFFANGTPIGIDTTSPYTVPWTNVAAGNYSITAVATDNLGATTTSAPISITVAAAGGGPRVNVALAANGATAVASTFHSAGYAPSGAINGDRTGQFWGAGNPAGGGWNDATPNTFPDWLEVDFSGSQTINEINVFSVQDAYAAPNVPTPTMTFSLYGLRDFEVQYWTGAAWAPVPGGTITGNNLVWRQVLFTALTTTKIRVFVTQTYDIWSRIAEVEAFTPGGGTNAAPAVTLTSPAAGPAGTAPAFVTVSANASDSDGTIASVAFFANGAPIGTAAASPYSIAWNNVAAGTYSVTAVATDNLALATTSAPVAITVNAPPAVALTAPAAGPAGTAPASITVSATASDSDGTIASVAFFANGTPIGTAASSPYSISWTNVAAGGYTLTAVATDNLAATTTSAGVAITVATNVAPTVALTAPAAGPAGTAPAAITVSANASDSDGTIASVAFFANGAPIGTDTTSPYSISWANVAAGSYSITAVATDNLGLTTTSAPIAVTVNATPAVALTAPVAGPAGPAPATISVSANASDSDGTIASVAFFANGLPIGTDATSPYGISWTNVAAGNYTLTAVATDNLGATTTSAGVSIAVATNAAPTVALTAPAAGPAGTAPATVTVSANASDSDGTIASVAFFANGSPIGTDTTSPFSISWANVAAGNYTLTALATDNLGATTTSAGVAITVATNAMPTVALTAPAAGPAGTAPATITVSANAGDSDGTIASVAFFANGSPIGTDTTSPYSISWTNVAAGNYTLTAIATDNLGATTTSAGVSITVTAAGPRVNVALAANGATAVASTAYNSGYAASGAINGDRTGAPWGSGGGWNDATPNSFPDWLEVDFSGSQTINEINVFSVQDAYSSPSVPTPAMTFSLYGLRNFDVQYWTGSVWAPVPGGTITGNNLVWRQVLFSALTTTKIRVYVTQTPDMWSRITEVEAFTPGGGNALPTVTLTSPAAGPAGTAPATVTVSANANDSDGTIASVAFFANGSPIGTDTTSPYSISLANVAAGNYTLTAVATDNLGGTTTSTGVAITVATNVAPTVALTAPASGSVGTASVTVTVSANASDSDGTIASVAFFANGSPIGTDTTAPYSISWPNVAAGSYSVTAVATDNLGLTTTSAPVVITVNAAPTVALTAPAAGPAGTAPANVTVSANASDSDGTISSVAFFANGSPVGTDTTSPYSISWTNVAAGNYTLTAVATDNLGGTTTSAGVSISVAVGGGGPRVNVALAANGATAVASSVYSPSFSPAGAINGDRKGYPWGSLSGWNDATPNTFPDWLEVDFSGSQTINEINVFSLQDAYTAPIDPTPTTTFTLYGLRNFEVQYWTGSAWAPVPGGTITGNSLVWRQILFGALTTTKIRVYVTQAADLWSRIPEVEAFTPGGGAPLVPAAIQSSDLTARLDLVGQIPTHGNPTSPVGAGSQLLLVDQAGYIYDWDGSATHPVLSPATIPAAITPLGAESVLNVAAKAGGTPVYVMFTSSTAPGGIPQRISPRPGADAWQVLYQYDFNGTSLSNPRAVTALQVRSDGHTGGGLAVLSDGSVLFATGDNGDAGEDGRAYAQDVTNHLSKILRIDTTDGSTQVVALGVRNVQRLMVDPNGGDPRVVFTDIGGSAAEEVNAIRVADLLAAGTHNFGWGRNAGDANAREGTFYIDASGVVVAAAPTPEAGFLQPIAQFGREGAAFVAASGPVAATPSFIRLTALFGDLVSGSMYGVTGALTQTGQTVFRVNLVDSQLQPTTAATLAGGRPDVRFFTFPDGTAGVLLERTGSFYRLTELPAS